jgi:hypothetical protein
MVIMQKLNKTKIIELRNQLLENIYLSDKGLINETESIEKFSSNRLNGASDIADKAEKKGGDALLTYHHFKVKLPYYKKAKENKMDYKKSKLEFEKLIAELSEKSLSLPQIKFQELVGKIEVLGELLIENKIE